MTFVVHAPALWGAFVYDDVNDITANPSAQAGTFLDRLPVTVRPLLKASYAVQDALHGMNAFAFHAVNLALHLGAVALVFLLILRLAALSACPPPRARLVAFVATLLWAIHPAVTETVSYVSGRSVGLSSLLILACLLPATSEKPHPALALLFAALAPLARETALIVPLLLLAVQVTVGRSLPFRRALPVWGGALVAAIILTAMPSHRDLVSFSLDQRGPLDALRANVFALPEILSFWVKPWTISALPHQPVIYGWSDPPTLMRLTALTLVPVTAFALRKRFPLAAFAMLWALLALLPTNSAIWRVDPVAIRPLYLAGLGLSLLLALALVQRQIGVWITGVLAIGLGVLTFQRAHLYHSYVALFADAAAKSPNEARAQTMLGLALANAGQAEDARAAFARALALDPFDTEAQNAIRVLDNGGQIYSIPTP